VSQRNNPKPPAPCCHYRFTYVLVSTGTELIFSLAVGTVPCFGFSMRIMLITHCCF